MLLSIFHFKFTSVSFSVLMIYFHCVSVRIISFSVLIISHCLSLQCNDLVRNLIIENKTLYTKILLYEPILLDEIIEPLQNSGYKIVKSKLMDYLDDKGITYRTRSTKKNQENKCRRKLSKYKRLDNLNCTLTKWQLKRLKRNRLRRLRYHRNLNRTNCNVTNRKYVRKLKRVGNITCVKKKRGRPRKNKIKSKVTKN